MRQNITPAPGSNISNILTAPLPQAVLTGALTLIPARNYPTWLRKSLVWGPTVVGVAGAVCFAAKPDVRAKLAERLPSAERSASGARKIEANAARSVVPTPVRKTATLIVTGGGVGAIVSVLTAGGFWADEKIERALRRINVPFPRVVMGAVAGLAAWYQAKQDDARNA